MARRWLFAAVLPAFLLALAACAAQEEAKPAPAAPAAAPAAPAAAPAAPAAKPAWEQEWERVLEAAKREGKVVVSGPAGANQRKALTGPFEKRYGISVEYLGQRGAEFVPRIRAEREAGQYLWDVFVGGTSTPVNSLIPMGALEPLEPTFILPEVKDPKGWQDGQHPFLGEGKVIAITRYVTEAFGYNTKLVDPKEFKSYKDLLDPKWKGKIVIYNPTVPGAGDAKLAFFYLHPELGPDFIRSLAAQGVIGLANIEQMMQWLASGQYAIAIGASPTAGARFYQEGLIKMLDPAQMKEGGSVHVGVGGVGLYNRAPHPNAAKVFLNWVLAKEGAAEFAKSGPYASTRVDVPKFVEDWRFSKPNYIFLDDEKGIQMRGTVRELAKEVFTVR